MAQDLTVALKNEPGALAAMGGALGAAGINIIGCCGLQRKGKGRVHILVEDAKAAKKVLKEAGIKAKKVRDVVVLDIEDRPGELGKVARRMADAGVNLNLLYLTGGGKLVLGSKDIEKARAAV